MPSGSPGSSRRRVLIERCLPSPFIPSVLISETKTGSLFVDSDAGSLFVDSDVLLLFTCSKSVVRFLIKCF